MRLLVWLMPGSGKVTINQRTIDNYFGRATSKMVLRQPLELTGQTANYDVYANVQGGGLSGQTDAIAGHHACADEDQRRSSPAAEVCWLRHPRPARQRAQEVRSARRPSSLPVQQALIGNPTPPTGTRAPNDPNARSAARRRWQGQPTPCSRSEYRIKDLEGRDKDIDLSLSSAFLADAPVGSRPGLDGHRWHARFA